MRRCALIMLSACYSATTFGCDPGTRGNREMSERMSERAPASTGTAIPTDDHGSFLGQSREGLIRRLGSPPLVGERAFLSAETCDLGTVGLPSTEVRRDEERVLVYCSQRLRAVLALHARMANTIPPGPEGPQTSRMPTGEVVRIYGLGNDNVVGWQVMLGPEAFLRVRMLPADADRIPAIEMVAPEP